MALTKDRDTKEKGGKTIYAVPVAAGVKILAGALVALNAAGFATPGAIATTLKGFGRAEEAVDNTGGSNGAVSITVRRGVFLYANSASADAITRADIKNDCYIVDDQTVAKTHATNTRSVAGKIDDVDATGVWVDFT